MASKVTSFLVTASRGRALVFGCILRYLRTCCGSHVTLYLGALGRRLAIPLKNFVNLGSLSAAGPVRSKIAERVQLIVLYARLAWNSRMKNCNTWFLEGLKMCDCPNFHHLFIAGE